MSEQQPKNKEEIEEEFKLILDCLKDPFYEPSAEQKFKENRYSMYQLGEYINNEGRVTYGYDEYEAKDVAEFLNGIDENSSLWKNIGINKDKVFSHIKYNDMDTVDIIKNWKKNFLENFGKNSYSLVCALELKNRIDKNNFSATMCDANEIATYLYLLDENDTIWATISPHITRKKIFEHIKYENMNNIHTIKEWEIRFLQRFGEDAYSRALEIMKKVKKNKKILHFFVDISV
jgi:hypothetical protein